MNAMICLGSHWSSTTNERRRKSNSPHARTYRQCALDWFTKSMDMGSLHCLSVDVTFSAIQWEWKARLNIPQTVSKEYYKRSVDKTNHELHWQQTNKNMLHNDIILFRCTFWFSGRWWFNGMLYECLLCVNTRAILRQMNDGHKKHNNKF